MSDAEIVKAEVSDHCGQRDRCESGVRYPDVFQRAEEGIRDNAERSAVIYRRASGAYGKFVAEYVKASRIKLVAYRLEKTVEYVGINSEMEKDGRKRE